MQYTVRLYIDKGAPYIVTGIQAPNEKEASIEAKKHVATIGYFPGMNRKEIIKTLVVETVVPEIITNEKEIL